MSGDVLARHAAFETGDVRIRPQHVGRDGYTTIAAFPMLVDEVMSDYSNTVVRTGWHHIDRLGQTGFVVDMRVQHIRALKLGDPVGFEFRVLDVDDKRWHALTVMRHRIEGWTAGMQEQINICIDFATRRVAPWIAESRDHLEALRALDAHRPWPMGFDRALSLAALEVA